jgi:hypothetical protein
LGGDISLVWMRMVIARLIDSLFPGISPALLESGVQAGQKMDAMDHSFLIRFISSIQILLLKQICLLVPDLVQPGGMI